MVKLKSNRKEEGYYTVRDLAEACNLTPFHVKALKNSGKIPAPKTSYKLSERKYYLKEEFDKLVKMINSGK